MLQTLKGHFQNLSRWRFNLEMPWQAASSLRGFDMILSHSYKPGLEGEALGKSSRARTQHSQQEAAICTSEANNNTIYLVSKMEAKLLILHHWGQWKKLNEGEKIHLLGPLKMLISWQYEIYSHHGRCTQNQVLLSILSLNLCVSSVTIGCEAAVLAMWRESKELLISNKRAVNFFWDLTFLSVFFSLHFY